LILNKILCVNQEREEGASDDEEGSWVLVQPSFEVGWGVSEEFQEGGLVLVMLPETVYS